MIGVIDRILQLNLYGWVATVATGKVGLLSLENINSTINHQQIISSAVEISAITGAIYGIYKVVKLMHDGFIYIINKIKEKKNEKRSKRKYSK